MNVERIKRFSIRVLHGALRNALLLLTGCTIGTSGDVLPDEAAITETAIIQGEDIFVVLGDGAERYLQNNFLQLAIRTYRTPEATMTAELYEFRFTDSARTVYDKAVRDERRRWPMTQRPRHVARETLFDGDGLLLRFEAGNSATVHLVNERVYVRIVSVADNPASAADAARTLACLIHPRCQGLSTRLFDLMEY